MKYPCDDSGEQLEEGSEALQLPLSDASDGQVAVLCAVDAGRVPPHVLVVEHERVEKVLPRHKTSRHACLTVLSYNTTRKYINE